MNKKSYLHLQFILLVIISIPCYSQSILWQKTYGGTYRDDPSTVLCHPDSGFVVLSSYQTTPNYSDIWLLRLKNNGDTMWTKYFGAPAKNEIPLTAEIFPDGYLIVGSIQGTASEGSILCMKCNSKGDTIWSVVYGNKTALSTCITRDSAIAVSGSEKNLLFFMKIKSGGDTAFSKVYGDTAEKPAGFSIIQTHDSGYAITAQITSKVTKKKVLWFLKCNSKGDTVWTKKYDNTIGITINDFIELFDNSFLLAGSKNASSTINPKSYLQKLSSQGVLLWEKEFGSELNAENIQKIMALSTNQIVTVGTRLGSNASEIVQRLCTSDGDQIYINEFGKFSDDQTTTYFKDFTCTAHDSMVIAAFTSPLKGGQTLIFAIPGNFEVTPALYTLHKLENDKTTPDWCYDLLGQRMSLPNKFHTPSGIRILRNNKYVSSSIFTLK